jgi:kynurenine 3-monooxygenase
VTPSPEYVAVERPKPEVMEKILFEYTQTRNPDAEAMCDLALYNYIEMRSSVVKSGYLFRKKVEGLLHRIFPKTVIPLYTMVSFSRIPYSEALRRWKNQSQWFDMVGWATNVGIAAAVTVVGLALVKKLQG